LCISAIVIVSAAVVVGYKAYFSARTMRVDVVRRFGFSNAGDLREWRVKPFRGRVDYRITSDGPESYVSAVSEKTASALFYKIKLDMKKRPVISWKWRVKKFPDKKGSEDLKSAKSDDFGARLYVIFPAMFFTRSRAIEYIWTEEAMEGAVSPSPYSRNLQLVVVESGKKEGVGWVYEERDIYDDYLRAFGEPPRYNIGAIAFMTDADSTGSSAEAHSGIQKQAGRAGAMRNIFRIKSRLQHKYLRLIEASLLLPTLVVGGCLYYLIFFLIADEIAIPEFVAVILYPALERINLILIIALPLLLALLWGLGMIMSHRMAGPIDRLSGELDGIVKTGDYRRRIQVRKDDDLRPFVENIDKLLAKIAEREDQTL